jgi:midasin
VIEMVEEVKALLAFINDSPHASLVAESNILPPPFLLPDAMQTTPTTNELESASIKFSRALSTFISTTTKPPPEDDDSKRKRANSNPLPPPPSSFLSSITDRMAKIEALYRRANSLFEWLDGPLVTAMRHGDLILLDEMSLAEDAVLERLNSVLEPSRTLTLAEKGGSAEEEGIDEIHGAENFRIFATMNPGGDFGKREVRHAKKRWRQRRTND